MKKLVITCEDKELEKIKQILQENGITFNETVICEYFDKQTLEDMYSEKLTDEQIKEIEKRWANREFTCLNAEVMELLLNIEKESEYSDNVDRHTEKSSEEEPYMSKIPMTEEEIKKRIKEAIDNGKKGIREQ